MGSTSGIDYADASWGPWRRCKKVRPLKRCMHCYAERDMAFRGLPFNTVTRSKTTFDDPLRWTRTGEVKPGSIVFTCQWGDFFHKEADAWRPEAWDIIRHTPFVYLLVTKRIERAADCLPPDWGEGWPNVVLVATAEDQDEADKCLPILVKIPAKWRAVSVEPMLGYMPYLFRYFDLHVCPDCGWQGLHSERILDHKQNLVCPECKSPYCADDETRLIHWVMAGSESGGQRERRPAEERWFFNLAYQCDAWHVPFFLKQMEVGGQLVKMPKLDGKADLLDGRVWDQVPDFGRIISPPVEAEQITLPLGAV